MSEIGNAIGRKPLEVQQSLSGQGTDKIKQTLNLLNQRSQDYVVRSKQLETRGLGFFRPRRNAGEILASTSAEQLIGGGGGGGDCCLVTGICSSLISAPVLAKKPENSRSGDFQLKAANVISSATINPISRKINLLPSRSAFSDFFDFIINLRDTKLLKTSNYLILLRR
jgi:hypothetical protein